MDKSQKFVVGPEIGLDELKVIQMDVLQAIDKFCRDNAITYSLACGTMLGAIRHGGYIPWDDDIDIYLLRTDYERLMAIFPETYNDYYSISSLERNAKWDKPYAKAFDIRTVVIGENKNDVSCGVDIDIFPVDDVPDDEKTWMNYDKKRRKLYTKYCQIFGRAPLKKEPLCILRWVRRNYLKWFISRRQIAERLDRYSKIWNGRGYSRVFECCQGALQKRPFKKEIFDKIKDYPFENRSFMGFDNYDEYLRNGFGDYMTLPPVEKRVSHHRFKAYWKG